MSMETSKNSGMLYFLVGILLVAVVAIGYFVVTGNRVSSGPESAVERSADALGDAADKVGDAAERTATPGG